MEMRIPRHARVGMMFAFNVTVASLACDTAVRCHPGPPGDERRPGRTDQDSQPSHSRGVK